MIVEMMLAYVDGRPISLASRVRTSDASVYRAGGWVSCPSACTATACSTSPVRIGGSDAFSSDSACLAVRPVACDAAAALAEGSAPPAGCAACSVLGSADARRPSPVAFMKPGNSMTVPEAWNTASP